MIALSRNLGLGRHRHFLSMQFWILTGAASIMLEFATGDRTYLLSASWSVFPGAVKAVGSHLSFHFRPLLSGQPFNMAQKLSCFFLIFILALFQIATRVAMSPTIPGRFQWYVRLSGCKQGARSPHR